MLATTEPNREQGWVGVDGGGEGHRRGWFVERVSLTCKMVCSALVVLRGLFHHPRKEYGTTAGVREGGAKWPNEPTWRESCVCVHFFFLLIRVEPA